MLKALLALICISTTIEVSVAGHTTYVNIRPMLDGEKCYYNWFRFWNVPSNKTSKKNRTIAPPLTLEKVPVTSYKAGPAGPESATRIFRRQTGGMLSTSVVYRDVNVERTPSYWDYDNFTIDYTDVSRYRVIDKVGRGKFSKTYSAWDEETHNLVVVKKLHDHTHPTKIRREVKILQALKGGPNIIELFGVVKTKKTGKSALIFEYVENMDWQKAFPKFTIDDVRFYVFEVLKALHYAHSNDVMYRDLKPSNIVMDYQKKKIRVIDWGQSELYHPNKEFRVFVSTRQYKGSELLVGLTDYDYSVDILALGCLFAGMLFNKEKFFFGCDTVGQLLEIAYVLGTDELYEYMRKYWLQLSSRKKRTVGVHERKPWTQFLNSDNRHLYDEQALDLINQMFIYDHQKLINAREAMEHRFFDSVRTDITQDRG